MFARSNTPVEYAMTHRAGANGIAEACLRPESVRQTAERVQKWVSTHDTCQSCSRLPAVRLSAGMALCGKCHTHKRERMGLRLDPTGLKPREWRASDAEPEPDGKQLHGYSIRFNEKSVYLWGFFEFIRPSAADRMEAEKPDMRALWNHDSSLTLARSSAGTLLAVKRSKGVWVEIDPPRWARGHVESVNRRDIQGMSFGFVPIEDDWWLEDGMPNREILDMDVIEHSPVSFPAYPSTSIKAVGSSERSSWRMEQETAERLRMAR